MVLTDKINHQIGCLFRSEKKHYFLFSLYILNGPVFIQPADVINRDQLIITTKSSYEREVFKCDGLNKEISVQDIKGKCSVLSLKHYSTCKLWFFFLTKNCFYF